MSHYNKIRKTFKNKAGGNWIYKIVVEDLKGLQFLLTCPDWTPSPWGDSELCCPGCCSRCPVPPRTCWSGGWRGCWTEGTSGPRATGWIRGCLSRWESASAGGPSGWRSWPSRRRVCDGFCAQDEYNCLYSIRADFSSLVFTQGQVLNKF